MVKKFDDIGLPGLFVLHYSQKKCFFNELSNSVLHDLSDPLVFELQIICNTKTYLVNSRDTKFLDPNQNKL